MSIANQIQSLTDDKSAIENAITERGGTLSQNGGFDTFAADIASIPSGSEYSIDDLIDGSISGIIKSNVASMRPSVFSGCQHITKIFLHDAAGTISNSVFGTCSSLTDVYVPKITEISGNYIFNVCYSLRKLCFPSIISISGTGVFNACSNLNKIVFGGSTMMSLSNVNTFNGSKYAITNTSTPKPKIYVDLLLVSDYSNATNWSSLNCTFLPIMTSKFSGDGTTAQFTITNDVPNDVFYIKVGNDFIEDYTYDSQTGIVTFATAPARGTDNIAVYHDGGQ